MPECNTPEQQLRCFALEAALRAFPDRELTTGGFLSSASQFETFLVSGLIRTGGNWKSAAEVGSNGVSVMVEAPGLAPETVERVRAAVAGVLA